MSSPRILSAIGTLLNKWFIGGTATGGILLKSVSGVLYVRNVADTADAPINAGSVTQDTVNVKYVKFTESVGTPAPVADAVTLFSPSAPITRVHGRFPTNTVTMFADLPALVITQVDSAADPTLSANTSSILTDSTGATPDTTIADVPAAVAAGGDATAASLASTNTSLTSIENSLSDLATQHNLLRADYADLKAAFNSLVDALQASQTIA